MRIIQRALLLLFGGVAALSIGCSTFKAPQMRSLESIELSSYTQDSAVVVVEVGMFNPNPVGATARFMNYEVSLDGKSAGRGKWEGNQIIPSRNTFALRLPLTIPQAALPVWEEVLGSKEKSTLDVPVQVTLKTFLGSHRFSFRVKEEIAFREILERWAQSELSRFRLRVTGVKIANASLNEQKLEIHWEVANPYLVAIEVDSLRVDVRVNNQYLGEIHTLDRLVLQPGETSSQVSLLSAQTLSLGTALLSGVLRMRWQYELNGDVSVGIDETWVNVPVRHSDKITSLTR
ncbi:LEA type 2 family protein [bacterium]|nr:LEA type 2 family protein [bacterium]